MVIARCPRCQVQIVMANHSGDFVHQCNSGINALDQEDKIIKGRWDDYTGSDYTLRTASSNVQNQNLGNKIMGQEGWVRENAKAVDVTARGANAQIMRQRQHLEYIPDINNIKQSPSEIQEYADGNR